MSNQDGYVFKPRSIIALERQIAACENDALRLILFAKKAGCLARHSRLIEAKAIIKELRAVSRPYDPRLNLSFDLTLSNKSKW